MSEEGEAEEEKAGGPEEPVIYERPEIDPPGLLKRLHDFRFGIEVLDMQENLPDELAPIFNVLLDVAEVHLPNDPIIDSIRGLARMETARDLEGPDRMAGVIRVQIMQMEIAVAELVLDDEMADESGDQALPPR